MRVMENNDKPMSEREMYDFSMSMIASLPKARQAQAYKRMCEALAGMYFEESALSLSN